MQKDFKYKLNVLLFTLPALLLFTVVVCYPVLQSLYKSLFDWDGLSKPVFVGFGNYVKLWGNDNFHLSNKNGFIFAAMITVYQIGLGLLLALVLSSKAVRKSRFFRTSYFMPVVISTIIAGQLWLQIYNPDYGLINKIFEALGMSYRQAWLSDDKAAIYAVSFVNAWQYMGIHLVLIYTAIKSIPEHYYEAAVIDGASNAKAHTKITMPLLGETFKFCLVISITGGLKGFNEMYVMTQGGPGTYTNTLTYMMYKQAFMANNYGFGCAVAAVLVLECLIFTVLINKFVARDRIVY
ncbi:MAG: sugar ABC transporter permease [Clostridia bacterium]|nr:sugar ABC transporter permease [Clostridia bacterium]